MSFLKSLIIITFLLIPLIKPQNSTSSYGNFSTTNNTIKEKKKYEEFTLPPINQIWDITVKMGEGFIIKIFSNPTTGYNWYIDNIEQIKDSKILNCINLNDNNSTGKFIVDNPENLIMGQPGHFEFKFSSHYNKTYIKSNLFETIVFVEKKPWENINYRVVQTRVFFK
jgi:predicted secreted protein